MFWCSSAERMLQCHSACQRDSKVIYVQAETTSWGFSVIQPACGFLSPPPRKGLLHPCTAVGVRDAEEQLDPIFGMPLAKELLSRGTAWALGIHSSHLEFTLHTFMRVCFIDYKGAYF